MTAAEEVTQAVEDVERISKAMFAAAVAHTQGQIVGVWEEQTESKREQYRAVVRELLRRDIVRVGHRPQKGERPMTGQEAMALDTLGTPP